MPEVHPRVAAALREQLRGLGADRVGWKMGLGIPSVEELAGPGSAVIGHLTSATRLPDGGIFDASGVDELRVETELALEVGPDLELAGVGVALELVDVGGAGGPLEDIVVGNVLHRAFLLGPSVAGAELGAARMIVNGEVRDSVPAKVDAAGTIATVAALLAAAGDRLRPGERILAGSLTHVPARAGDHLAAEIEGLGRLEVSIG
jgi:2-keto-4-pentenoate hydratase